MSELCNKIHQLFNGMKRFHFKFVEDNIPENGIYILFEKGEKAHGVDRIVRIGTHRGNNNLKSRLKEHFKKINKNRSIFRTHIGTCYLKKENDVYREIWDKNMTPREVREKYKDRIDMKKENNMEERVTKYIQENFSFVVFQVDDKDKRHEIESKIISTVSLCDECKCSKNWLGSSSSKDKISKSGLWNIQGLYKKQKQLNEDDFKELQAIVNRH